LVCIEELVWEIWNKKLCMSGGRKVAAPPSDLFGDRLITCPKEMFITGKHQRNTMDGFNGNQSRSTKDEQAGINDLDRKD
jgi:hypothetical protein